MQHPVRAMRLTRWDLLVAVQAALLASIALAIAWLVTAASDEGAVGWGTRAGRTLPLTPLGAAVGAWGALARVRARGEVTALSALGRAPSRTAAPAVVGGALVGLLASLVIGTVPSVDVSGFYPVATRSTAWEWHDGSFEDRVQGLRVDADGGPIRLKPSAFSANLQGIPPHGRLAAALATALAALALGALSARAALSSASRSSARNRASRNRRPRFAQLGNARFGMDPIVAAASATASVVLFQAAAAQRTYALWAIVPPALLLAFAAGRYRAWR
jgi:hypothetical protein